MTAHGIPGGREGAVDSAASAILSGRRAGGATGFDGAGHRREHGFRARRHGDHMPNPGGCGAISLTLFEAI